MLPETSRDAVIPETSRDSVVPETSRDAVLPETSRVSVLPETIWDSVLPETSCPRYTVVPDWTCECSGAAADSSADGDNQLCV